MKIDINLPDSTRKDWQVVNFEISNEQSQITYLRSIHEPYRRGYIKPGKYVKLLYRGQCVMSNSTDEIKDHLDFIKNATGDILITGLGLGVCIHGLINENKYNKITVIEKSKEVIDLCGNQFKQHKNIEIIHADAMTYQIPSEANYDCVWHDIWFDIDAIHYPLIKKLKSKFKDHAKWQGAWCEEIIKKDYSNCINQLCAFFRV